MDKSAAFFRASNLFILDYCFAEALESALHICDEAIVVVDKQSQDGTLDWVYSLQHEHGMKRVKVLEREWLWDRMWQERVWTWSMEATDAEWFMYTDADELMLPEHAKEVHQLLRIPKVKLISLPYIHLYGTPRWQEIKQFYPRTTRLGRRSHGFRMRNWCSDKNPRWAACQVVWGPDERNANNTKKAEGLFLAETPIFHYGWCRSALALNVSQTKHFAWYRDGDGLEDGHIPEVPARPLNWAQMFRTERLERYTGPHPAFEAPWFVEHLEEWSCRDKEAEANAPK